MTLNRLTAPVQQAARRLLGQASSAPTAPAGQPGIHNPVGNAYVRTVLLPEVGDLARPDDVWEEKHWGQRSGIKAVIEQLGYRQGSKHWVSASVELVLPAETVQHDRRLGGQLAASLAQALTALHNRDFRNRLPEGMDTARYAVREASNLPPGQARVRLGPAVHVALPGEAMAWSLEHSIDGLIWHPTAQLAEQQRLFILSSQESLGTQALADWPLPPGTGLVVLNPPGEAALEFSAEPLDSLCITLRPDLGCQMVQARQAGPEAPRLFIRATRLQAPARPVEPDHPALSSPATPYPPPRIEPSLEPAAPPPPTPAQDDAPTLMHRATPPMLDDAPTLYAASPPRPGPALVLVGLALQRPSTFAGTGVKAVQWALDAQGAVLPPDAATRQLRFTVGDDDRVQVATAAGERTVALDEALPLPGSNTVLRLQALPVELGAHYLGWLPLQLQRAVPLAAGVSFTVGRQTPTLGALRPLAGPGFLAGPEAVPATGGDRMGLSRQHVELRAGPQGLEVQALGQATVAHLDAGMRLVGLAGSTTPARLAPGDCLVVGHYVWRYRGDGPGPAMHEASHSSN